MNDNLYTRFLYKAKFKKNEAAVYDVNLLQEEELKALKKILDKHALWGKHATWTHGQKMKYLGKRCNGELKVILLDLFRSADITRKINKSLDRLLKDRNIKEILLLTFVCKIMAVELSIRDVVNLTGYRTHY